jgi:hypothetical protein
VRGKRGGGGRVSVRVSVNVSVRVRVWVRVSVRPRGARVARALAREWPWGGGGVWLGLGLAWHLVVSACNSPSRACLAMCISIATPAGTAWPQISHVPLPPPPPPPIDIHLEACAVLSLAGAAASSAAAGSERFGFRAFVIEPLRLRKLLPLGWRHPATSEGAPVVSANDVYDR